MPFVNRTKLKSRLIEKGMTSKDLCEELSISRTALSLKMNCKRHFHEEEMRVLANLFGKDVFFLD